MTDNDSIRKLARELGPKPIKVELYLCPDCGEEHDNVEDAADCCPRDFETVIKYECPICRDTYDDEDDAHACCEPELPPTTTEIITERMEEE